MISQRGDDFTLTIGQDASIAYVSHTRTTVTLELQESIAFLATSPEAGVAVEIRFLTDTARPSGIDEPSLVLGRRADGMPSAVVMLLSDRTEQRSRHAYSS